ncbi:YkuJ family protein [Limosilactobacillus viscerum]|uniref:YkuJ family protein n=1 Tax=Limosilactobacillus viscerum TaxID=2993450 RepID=UPI0024B939E0|nr:YkuJ family protein [Limosilactobacillus viscerum]
MSESQLVQIIRRLEAMKRDQTGKRQKRTFEQFGIPVCEVTYTGEDDNFIFVRFRPQERFRFDDIDLVAIEVYDCLYDLQHTF